MTTNFRRCVAKPETLAGAVALLVCGLLLYRLWVPRVTSVLAQKRSGEIRMAAARARSEAAVRTVVERAGLTYPPREIFLRAFKREATLEAWAREDSGPFKLLAEYRVLASSGQAGPKRREGDQQVPEGFYRIDRFNPESLFHLSLGLDYPNSADAILSDREHPGSDIFIHGKAASIGCLPIGDAAIEQLYLLALDVRQRGQKEIAVHIFPARMGGPDWETFAREQIGRDPALAGFWRELQPGYEAFERTKNVPVISVESDGRYRVTLAL